GAHDERLVAVLGVGRQEGVEVRYVQADPLALLVGHGGRRLGVPPDELLLLTPRLAGEVGRRPVVEDAPVRGPRESPAVPEVVLLVSRLARVRLVDELAVGVLDRDAGVDPAAAGRLTVVGPVG